LVQGRKRGGSGRGGTRRRAGGFAEMIGRMTMTGTRGGRRGNTVTGAKAKVGLLNRYSFWFFGFISISRMLKSLQLQFSFYETLYPYFC
jgi:hypothetical protein